MTQKRLNFKASWWVNISSLPFKFNSDPALKNTGHQSLSKALLSREPFLSLLPQTKRLHCKINIFFHYLCCISRIIGTLWRNSLLEPLTVCMRSLVTGRDVWKNPCYHRCRAQAVGPQGLRARARPGEQLTEPTFRLLELRFTVQASRTDCRPSLARVPVDKFSISVEPGATAEKIKTRRKYLQRNTLPTGWLRWPSLSFPVLMVFWMVPD